MEKVKSNEVRLVRCEYGGGGKFLYTFEILVNDKWITPYFINRTLKFALPSTLILLNPKDKENLNQCIKYIIEDIKYMSENDYELVSREEYNDYLKEVLGDGFGEEYFYL